MVSMLEDRDWKVHLYTLVPLICSQLGFVVFSFVPYPIKDSIWLAHGSFLVGAGHQMFLYSQPRLSHGEPAESLFEYVGRHNGPLEDYHPQMLLQCLLWGMSLSDFL